MLPTRHNPVSGHVELVASYFFRGKNTFVYTNNEALLIFFVTNYIYLITLGTSFIFFLIIRETGESVENGVKLIKRDSILLKKNVDNLFYFSPNFRPLLL